MPRGQPIRNGKAIGEVVGQISEWTWEEWRIYLSAIVVLKNTGFPGGGFFGLSEIPPEFARDEADWINAKLTQNEKVFVSWDDHLAALPHPSDSRLGRRCLHGILSVAGDPRIAQLEHELLSRDVSQPPRALSSCWQPLGLSLSVRDLCSAHDQVYSEHPYPLVFPQNVYHLITIQRT